MTLHRRLAALAALPLVVAAAVAGPAAGTAGAAAAPTAAGPWFFAAPVQVVVDGQPLSLHPAPVIVDDRTLVPLRGVVEAMGATPVWNGETRTVEIRRGDRYARLRIDRRLACLEPACTDAATLDVPARIIADRTFVPVRFIAQALGASVDWDPQRRAVRIDTGRQSAPTPAPVRLTAPLWGQVIGVPTELRAQGPAGSHVQFYLIDPATGVARMIGAGSDPAAGYTYVPEPADAGQRLVVAAVRDARGVMGYGDPIPVTVRPDYRLRMTGIHEGGQVTGPVTVGTEVGFVATQVAIVLTDPPTGSIETLGNVGPGEGLTWYPQIGHNGVKQIYLVATDRQGREYRSQPVTFRVLSGYRQFVGGIDDGDVLTRGEITLRPLANYPVEQAEYLLDGRLLGSGSTFVWRYGPADNGKHSLIIRLTDGAGAVHTTEPVQFEVRHTRQVWPSGIGPNQVVTGAVSLKAISNAPVASFEFHLVDAAGASVERLGSAAAGSALPWTPQASHAGSRRLLVIGRELGGAAIQSKVIPFRVYLGKVYGPQPIVPKSEFLALAASLSVPAYRETGMSAALKVAQAILETGWGQSTPVDKYTGQVSNNPFGIKGQGPAGSVISNTWEEYNGVSYRVDDHFRAYHNVAEAWQDHADLLLTRSWYAPYRAVMTEPVLGAWALRRSGYATDSRYPIKLINIMQEYNLFKLDEFDF